jgi:hypothetical protein
MTAKFGPVTVPGGHRHHSVRPTEFACRAWRPAGCFAGPASRRRDPDPLPRAPRDASRERGYGVIILAPRIYPPAARLHIQAPTLPCGSHRDAGIIAQHFGIGVQGVADEVKQVSRRLRCVVASIARLTC